MTESRMAVFEPVAKELVRRLELHDGRIEAVLGIVTAPIPSDADEIAERTPMLDQLVQADAPDASAQQALEQMSEADELKYHGTRRHRGSLCPKCVFYRRFVDNDEACDAYEMWLVNPPVKREECGSFLSR